MSRSFFIFNDGGDFCLRCLGLCRAAGLTRATSIEVAYFAVAPKLERVLHRPEFDAPVLGTLIFHPSALPYRRGPDAIRHAIASGERVSAVTWFWCERGLDTGPICEQEVVVLKRGESAGRAYHTRFVPAGLRALERAIVNIVAGKPRRVPQEEALATYDGKFVLR